SIRLLRLLPHADTSTLMHCQLFDHLINNPYIGHHQFRALYAVWVFSNTARPIFIHGHEMSVTGKLYLALLRPRDHAKQR
ncbi:hypothetical protein K504DRAFT_335367, partial [Pleomassaria siparia CBS 279.74]